MALSYSTLRHIPSLYSYEAAAAHEAKVKPIRGDANGTKPLGRRDQKWQSIKREDNGDITAYRGSYPLARWHVDGTITIFEGKYWIKASENDVVSCLLPGQLVTFNGRAWYCTHDSDVPISEKGTRFKHDERGALRPVDANRLTVVTHVLNRKAVKEGLAPYERYLQTALGMIRVRGGELPSTNERENYFPHIGYGTHDPDHWGTKREGAVVAAVSKLMELMRSEEPGDNYKAFLIMVYNMHYTGSYRRGPSGWTRPITTKTEDWRKKLIHYLLLSDPHKYLTRKEHTDGKMRRDAYGKYLSE